MADSIATKKITELPENTGVTEEDLLVVGNAGTPALRKLKMGNLITWLKEKLGINELNTKTEDTGWIKATLTSDFEEYDTGTNPKYRRIGKQISICGQIKNKKVIASNASASATAFVLPSGFRPTALERTFMCQGSGKNWFLLRILENGNVNVQRYGATEYAEMPVGAWLTFNVSFFI